MQYLHNLEIVCTALTILFILALVALWVVIANSVRMGVLLDASAVEADLHENHLALLDRALHLDGLGHMSRLQKVAYLARVYADKPKPYYGPQYFKTSTAISSHEPQV